MVDEGPMGAKAPDGGWGWAVLFGCFVITGFSYAFPKAVSVFFKELMREFGIGYSDTAWISSILLAMLYGTGEATCGKLGRGWPSPGGHRSPMCGACHRAELEPCRPTVASREPLRWGPGRKQSEPSGPGGTRQSVLTPVPRVACSDIPESEVSGATLCTRLVLDGLPRPTVPSWEDAHGRLGSAPWEPGLQGSCTLLGRGCGTGRRGLGTEGTA